MLKLRAFRSIGSALALLLLPGVALAEVSVMVHPRTGEVQKVFYLAGVRGDGTTIVWSQVRPGVPRRFLLNPLGDTLEDGPPVIRTDPASGLPWVVWAARVTNVHQIAISHWAEPGWSPRRYVVPFPAPYYHDDINPDLTFDAQGRPFLVWERSGSIGSILFSTLLDGHWTEPLRISPEGVDSRSPSITIEEGAAKVRFLTPDGWVTTDYETAVMVKAASGNLMDTPIPPGDKDDGEPPGGTVENEDGFMRK